MHISNEQIRGIPVLKLSGRLDAYTASAVEQLFEAIPTAPLPYMILDFSNVDFIDSTGLATLVIGMKRCRQHNGELVLCNVRATVRTIFDLTRLDKVFMLSGTQEEAIANIQDRQNT